MGGTVGKSPQDGGKRKKWDEDRQRGIASDSAAVIPRSLYKNMACSPIARPKRYGSLFTYALQELLLPRTSSDRE